MPKRGRWEEERLELADVLENGSALGGQVYGAPRRSIERRLKQVEAYLKIAKAGNIPQEEWYWLEAELKDIERKNINHLHYKDKKRPPKALSKELEETQNALKHLLSIEITDWQGRILFLGEAGKYEDKSSREQYAYWAGQERRHWKLMDELEWLYWETSDRLKELDQGKKSDVYKALYKKRPPRAEPHHRAIEDQIILYWKFGLKREIKLSRSEKNPLVNFTMAVFECLVDGVNADENFRDRTYRRLLAANKRCQDKRRPFQYVREELFKKEGVSSFRKK